MVRHKNSISVKDLAHEWGRDRSSLLKAVKRCGLPISYLPVAEARGQKLAHIQKHHVSTLRDFLGISHEALHSTRSDAKREINYVEN